MTLTGPFRGKLFALNRRRRDRNLPAATDMTFEELVTAAGVRGASDVHLRAGEPPFVRIGGQLHEARPGFWE